MRRRRQALAGRGNAPRLMMTLDTDRRVELAGQQRRKKGRQGPALAASEKRRRRQRKLRMSRWEMSIWRWNSSTISVKAATALYSYFLGHGVIGNGGYDFRERMG